MKSLWDEIQEDTTRELLEAPAAKRPTRFTEWSNAHSFIDGGYLARIVRQTCKSCGESAETAVGVFHVEIKPGASARRLTMLSRGAQWPVAEHLPLEVEETTTDWCPACLRLVGFDAERPAQVGFVHGAGAH